MEYVIKRDGRKAPFDRVRIYNAIKAAMKHVDHENDVLAFKIAIDIERMTEPMSVEQIQDLVEQRLMESDYKDVAKAYIIYRAGKSKIRSEQMEFDRIIGEKLRADNVQNQNANVDEASFGGRKGEADSEMMRRYALNNIVSDMARKNHENNMIYIHDLDSYAVGMHNCAKRTTKFITDRGVFSFEDFSDGDHVTVLTHTGQYKNATVHCFGLQYLQKITFYRAGVEQVEYFTPNHRWILQDGSQTIDLDVGDKVAKAPNIRHFDFDSASESEQYYWCLGFVLGDGVNASRWSHGVKQADVQFVRLRLCGEKVKYANRFKNLKHSVKELDNGDLYLTFSSTIGFTKQFPDITNMTIAEKHAMFDGLYCADGQQTGNRKSITTTDEQIASFIEDICPSFGYYITHVVEKTGEQTNYGKRGFTKEFTFTGDRNKYYWTVVDIDEGCVEDVWCLDVEEDHSFVLPNGIVTGNCLTLPFDDLLANGFNTRQTDVRPANSVSTAFQLIAVLFQLQSLQQFGGVSASHLDWSMVPYVRKSFIKHYNDGLRYIEGLKPFSKDTIKRLLDVTIEHEHYKQHEKVWQYAMDKTKDEIEQAVEGMFHNLNTLQSRSGNQLPFTSINFGTCTLPEGRMIIRALLLGSIGGVGKLHKTPVFPCSIFQCMKGINRKPGDPNYDLFRLALESTALRLYPNYVNVDWSGNKGFDVNDPRTYMATMGKCKLQPI